MRRTWLYLKLAALLLGGVMMYGNLENNRVFAFGCSGGCENSGTGGVNCKCGTAIGCGCSIQPGETGCGVCSGKGGEEETLE